MSDAADAQLPELEAHWVFDERDLVLTAKLVPGAAFNVLRWPVAFCLVYLGISMFPGQTTTLYNVLSALVLCALWVGLLLGLRRIQIRGLSRLPEEQRRVRLSLRRGTLRYEDASGRAEERPLGDVAGAVVRAEGVLFRISNRVVFMPDRALGDSADVWREAFSRVPAWTRPIGRSFTLVLWAFAAAVAMYGLAR